MHCGSTLAVFIVLCGYKAIYTYIYMYIKYILPFVPVINKKMLNRI